VQDQADRIPPRPVANDRPAEQLDVVIAAAQKQLVERLLERPDDRGDGSAGRATQSPGPHHIRAHRTVTTALLKEAEL
jgi:hypothetical protein